MARLFSNSEYIDIVLVYGEACGGAPRVSVRLLHVGVKNASTTIRNNRGMLERVEESFRRRLHFCIYNNGGHFEHFL
jgi:GrpB-like predicted nucleotidyltransferase (UPF0157 family)